MSAAGTTENKNGDLKRDVAAEPEKADAAVPAKKQKTETETAEAHSTTNGSDNGSLASQGTYSAKSGELAQSDGSPKSESAKAQSSIKAEEEQEPPTKLERDIIKQVEFYFSDVNLPRDAFLKEQIQKDEGWVPLSVLTTFKRLAALSTDHAVICSALRKSDSGLLEIAADNQKLRRDPDRTLKMINLKELNSRTLYVKGFPKELTIDDVLKYFDEIAPQYEKVVFRRERSGDAKGDFKGSVFVLFKKDKEAMDFLLKHKAGSETPLKFRDETLEVCSKEEYSARKMAEKQSNKGPAQKNEKNGRDNNQQQAAAAPFDYSSCAIIKIHEVAPNTSREDLKGVFKPFVSETMFISFSKGASSGFLRISSEDVAKEALEKIANSEKKFSTPQGEFKAELMTSEEEKKAAIELLKKDEQDMRDKGSSSGGGGGGGHRGGGKRGGGGGYGRGGRGGHRGGRGGGGNRNPFSKNKSDKGGDKESSEATTQPQAKRTKFDSDED